MDKDDKIFNAVLNQMSARETANLTYMTISSSASLVFLGLIGISGNGISNLSFLEAHWWVAVFGIIFPLLALTYNEVTRLTVHKQQQLWVRKKTDFPEILKITYGRIPRMILSYVIVTIPVVGWTIASSIVFAGENASFWIIMGLIAVIVGIIILTQLGKPEKNCKKDG